MHELQDRLGSLAVTVDDKFDPARAIQQLCCICTELDALGDTVVPTPKTHAFLKAFPDKHYCSFKTVLLCEKPRDGSAALDFDDVANRATTYHAMRIRGKVSQNDDGSGSHSRASYTGGHASSAGKEDVWKDVVAEEMTAGPRTGTTARRTVTTATVASTRTGTHTEAAALEARKVYALSLIHI